MQFFTSSGRSFRRLIVLLPKLARASALAFWREGKIDRSDIETSEEEMRGPSQRYKKGSKLHHGTEGKRERKSRLMWELRGKPPVVQTQTLASQMIDAFRSWGA